METYSLQDYSESFATIDELINFVMMNGICPSCQIIKDGEKTGEYVQEYLSE